MFFIKETGLRLLAILCIIACFAQAEAQRRWHFDLDYRRLVGLSERVNGRSFGWNSLDDFEGNSLRFAVRYDISQRVSAGVGVGVDWYRNAVYGAAPFYATCRYKLIRDKRLYAFANLGYSPGDDEDGDPFSRGVLFDLGIGYPLMLSKTFGFNFQFGYSFSRFNNVVGSLSGAGSNRMIYDNELLDGCRHSLSFGVGIVF